MWGKDSCALPWWRQVTPAGPGLQGRTQGHAGAMRCCACLSPPGQGAVQEGNARRQCPGPHRSQRKPQTEDNRRPLVPPSLAHSGTQLLLEETVCEKLITGVFRQEVGKPHFLPTPTSPEDFYLQLRASPGPGQPASWGVLAAPNSTPRSHPREPLPGLDGAVTRVNRTGAVRLQTEWGTSRPEGR